MKNDLIRVYVFAVCAFASGVLLNSSVYAQSYDIVIANGRVIDPATKLDAVRYVAIEGDKIAAISETPLEADRIIDASGLIVSPGFIDIHTHSNELPGQRLQAFDGVTTGLEMESGLLPVAQWYDRQAKEGRVINYGISAAWTFARVVAMEPDMPPVKPELEWYQSAFKFSNWVKKPSTPEQQEEIIALLQQGLDEGAIGIGVNSGYAPGAGGKELMAVWELAAANSVPISTHLREWSMVDPLSSVEGVSTVVGMATVSGARTNICHVNSTGLGDGEKVVELLTSARDKGVDLHAEAYPYGLGTFPVASSIFQVDHNTFKQRIGVDFTAVRLLSKKRDIRDESDIRAEQKSDPGQGVILTYLDENKPKDEAVLEASVVAPWIAIASDAIPITLPDGSFVKGDTWPLPKEAATNPRTSGTFSRFFGRWVREKGALGWPEAISKATLIPALLYEGMVATMDRKGRLQVGMDADITIFDPRTIIDRSTVEDSLQTSKGIAYLIVNGALVIDDGIMDFSLRAGRPIRRIVVK